MINLKYETALPILKTQNSDTESSNREKQKMIFELNFHFSHISDSVQAELELRSIENGLWKERNGINVPLH